MTKVKEDKPEEPIPCVPFEEAVKRMLSAPPQHKKAKKPAKS